MSEARITDQRLEQLANSISEVRRNDVTLDECAALIAELREMRAREVKCAYCETIIVRDIYCDTMCAKLAAGGELP